MVSRRDEPCAAAGYGQARHVEPDYLYQERAYSCSWRIRVPNAQCRGTKASFPTLSPQTCAFSRLRGGQKLISLVRMGGLRLPEDGFTSNLKAAVNLGRVTLLFEMLPVDQMVEYGWMTDEFDVFGKVQGVDGGGCVLGLTRLER
ncbi:hypothetical protein CPB86DRAFT_147033 [Serendipita vermifera]|nr:hypothetical protein CPB86DRAFT_147033 [Serendipita vermifera]